MEQKESKKEVCPRKRGCPFYKHASVYYTLRVCDSMSLGQILKGRECHYVEVELSKLDKILRKYEGIEKLLKESNRSVKNYLKGIDSE